MGLAQRRVEQAGISTVGLSMIPALTAAWGAPRVAGIEFPFGRPLGQPHDAGTQRAVLRATLEALRGVEEPGTIVHLPFEWPELADRVQWHPKEPAPIARLLRRDPAAFKRLVEGELPSEASRRR